METGTTSDRHKSYRFTGLEFVLSILRIVLYIVDLVTDLHLASSYFQDGLVNYGALTTTFFGLAYIVVVFFGLARYVDNSDVPAAWWVCRIVFLILGLSPVILLAVLAVKAHNSDTGDESTDNEKDKFSCKLFYFLWRVV
nr:hypothetical protein BaRGS_019938 [Batillaria attramentaria]